MKSGDKIEFTKEQRESLLHLYAQVILTSDSAETAQDRASLASRTMWGTVINTLNLDRQFTYRLLPGFNGVLALQGIDDSSVELEPYEVIEEWKQLRARLLTLGVKTSDQHENTETP